MPKSKRNRREKLAEWKQIPCTTVLYEAPHRIIEVLKDILSAWGDRPLVLARELTKLHEEFFRGTVTKALEFLGEHPPRGEFVLVIGGSTEISEPKEAMAPLEKVRMLMAQGTDKKSALGAVAKEYKVPKRDLYNRLLQEEGEKQ